MVKILIAPDKFKGSLTADQVCDAAYSVLAGRGHEVRSRPLADGGDGTFQVLIKHFKARVVEARVHDPLMRKITARYGLSGDGTTAFIEMASASGLELLRKEERNPLLTTTLGTGELVADALDKGAKEIILGIGGSATNDAGVGMALALGYTFYNNERSFQPIGGALLKEISKIDRQTARSTIASTKITTLCDVKNPLTGDNGAARVFATQKGATAEAVVMLEENLKHLKKLLKEHFGFDADFPGAGAAGGLGAGAKFFLNAQLVNGMQYISGITHLEDEISWADAVITGEGKLDTQSLSGKVVDYVATLCRRHHKKLIVLCGACDLNDEQLRLLGIDECHVLSRGVDRSEAIRNAFSLIQRALTGSSLLRQL